MTPDSANSLATSPMRRMFSSRSWALQRAHAGKLVRCACCVCQSSQQVESRPCVLDAKQGSASNLQTWRLSAGSRMQQLLLPKDRPT